MKREPPFSDNEVGYCRPPLHTRFKPGQSGNPKGRPKGRKIGFVELLSEALEKSVPVRVEGKIGRMTRARAFAEGLVADAVRGKTAERKLLLAFLSSQQAAESALPFDVAGAAQRLKEKLQYLIDAKEKRERLAAEQDKLKTSTEDPKQKP